MLLRALERQGLSREPIILYTDEAKIRDWLKYRARPRRKALREAVLETRQLVGKFKRLRIYHLDRRRNLRAHRLARLAMRGEGLSWQP